MGGGILLLWALVAVFWPFVVPYDPQAVGAGAPYTRPSGSFWFGTDNLGRDVFSRVLAGARPVLTVAPLAALLGLVLGTITGLMAGYYRGWVDNVAMRVVDAMLGFPLIILAALVLAALGVSVANVIIVIGIAFMPPVARTVRAAVLVEREREYVQAARLRGQRGLSVMYREILPNVRRPLAVEGSVRFGYAVFTSATLSFLGLGLQQPSPDWGLTISVGRQVLEVAPWIVLFPVAALASLVVAVTLMGEGLRTVLEEA